MKIDNIIVKIKNLGIIILIYFICLPFALFMYIIDNLSEEKDDRKRNK
jgi:hypothetical protein